MYMRCNCNSNFNINNGNCNCKKNCGCDSMNYMNDMIDNTCDNMMDSCDYSNINPCSCGFDEYDGLPDNPMLAQAYVPIQQFSKTFCPEVGLRMGTIFPDLVRPYMPCQSIRENQYIANTNVVKGGCNCGM